MPLEYKVIMPGFSGIDKFMNYTHFHPNSIIDLLGKQFKILGTDLFTKNFMLSQTGETFEIFQPNLNKGNNKTELIIPPHNGFGNEDDSLQNVLKLIPNPPKKDFYSLMYKTEVLKMTAILLTNKDSNSV